MMYKLLFGFIIIITSLSTKAQNNEVDSLLKVLDATTIDSNKLNTLMQIGNLYMFNNVSKGIEYFEKGITLASTLNEKEKLARLYILNGFCYRIKADFDKSLENYLNAARIYEKEDKRNKLGSAYISVADVYSDIKNIKKASEYYDKAEVIILKQKDSFELSHLYFEKGILFDKDNAHETSMEYFQKAYAIGKLLKNDMVITNALSAIGANYKNSGKVKEALNCYDTVKQIYTKNNKETADLMASLYINYGEAYLKGNDLINAKAAFEKSISYARSAGLIDIEMNNYKSLATLYSNKKDYANQVLFLSKYYNLKDSLYTSDGKNQLTQLEANYKIEKKNSEIVKKEVEVVKGKQQRNIFISVAAGMLLLLGGLSFFYSRIKNKNTQLAQQNIQINKQKDELQTLNGVKDRLFSIISHDLRNPLITLRSYLSLSDNTNISDAKKIAFKKQTSQAVSQTTDMLDNLLVWANMQIKNTNANITPVDIEEVVLDAIDNVHAQAQQKNIIIHKTIQVASALGDKNILNIALRNLLTNAIKYSEENKNIFISATQKNNQVLLSIRDEGIGMTTKQLANLQNNEQETTKGTQGEKGSGLGLFLVKELLAKANNKLIIESEPENGSVFTIEL
jgi:signal transduction histidine kinase